MKKIIDNDVLLPSLIYEGYFNDKKADELDSDDYTLDNYSINYKYTVSFEFSYTETKKGSDNILKMKEIESDLVKMRNRLSYGLSLMHFVEDFSTPDIYLTFYNGCNTTLTFPDGLVVHDSIRSSFYKHLERVDMFNIVCLMNLLFNSVNEYVKFKKWLFTKLCAGTDIRLDVIRFTINDSPEMESWLGEKDDNKVWSAISDSFYNEIKHLFPVGDFGKYTERKKFEDGMFFFMWYGADIEKTYCNSFDYNKFVNSISEGHISLKKVHRVDDDKLSLIRNSMLKAPTMRSRDISSVISYQDLINDIDGRGCYLYFWNSSSFGGGDIMFSIIMNGTVVGNNDTEYQVFINVNVNDPDNDTCCDNLYNCMKLFSECSDMSVKDVYYKVEEMISDDVLDEQIKSKLNSVGYDNL